MSCTKRNLIAKGFENTQVPYAGCGFKEGL